MKLGILGTLWGPLKWYLAAVLSFVLLLTVLGLMGEPPAKRMAPEARYNEDQTEGLINARQVAETSKAGPVFWRDVDYSEGEGATWYPKGQSSLLEELVAAGDLPALTERVPSEPLVLEGSDGVGSYGGTWLRLARSNGDMYVMGNRMSCSTLLRFSAAGRPVVPHLAKSFEVSPDQRVFTITLREGTRWSDGHPFTTADIDFFFKHIVYSESEVAIYQTKLVEHLGERMEVEIIDETTVRFIHKHPHPTFLENLANVVSIGLCNAPAHYLSKYHPDTGDPELIAQKKEELNLSTDAAVFKWVHDPHGLNNAEIPRLWPWIPASVKGENERSYVRNPYYFAVDSEGNQLPYIDRLLFQVRPLQMLSLSAASGDASMQARHLKAENYSLLMMQRDQYDYDLVHYLQPGKVSLFFNMQRLRPPGDIEAAYKAKLLEDQRFRKAVSLALNRKELISKPDLQPLFAGGPPPYIDPEGVVPVEFDPKRADQLLDEVGLDQRDDEGFRCAADGTRLSFLALPSVWVTPETIQILSEQLNRVGLRVVINNNTKLARYITIGRNWDFSLSPTDQIIPVEEADGMTVTMSQTLLGRNLRGSLWDEIHAKSGWTPPDESSHPLFEGAQLADRILAAPTREEQQRLLREMSQMAAEEVWEAGISLPPPQVAVVRNNFKNVPRAGIYAYSFMSPANLGIETYFFTEDENTDGARELIKDGIVAVSGAGSMTSGEGGTTPAKANLSPMQVFFGIVTLMVFGMLVLSIKHPFILRRLALMVPLLFFISIIIFVVIQLPPGDFVTEYIAELEAIGESASDSEIEALRETFWLDESGVTRYARWMGFPWFLSFDSEDRGLLQGHMGRSMESLKMVNDLIGERLVFTFAIALFSVLFTWALAIPIGIYSACRQYSVGDYVFSVLGFIGMSVPGFLLAILLMYVSDRWFGFAASGLFSAKFAAQPYWSIDKFIDLLKHIWIPILIMGVSGTAGMIRVMRANLLDELRKPYVTTARAKGVGPIRLLFKYPVRVALNPFVSGIGGLLPSLVSGGTIVAITLSLPTIGPLLLDAIFAQDVYFASSQLMLLTFLSVFGVIVSDVLLICLDPRIRIGPGGK